MDREQAARHVTVENRTSLAWDDACGRHRMDARLDGLSHTEALLVAEVLPPARQRVWLRLERPAATNWVAAVVVRATRGLRHRVTGKGTCRIRLRFLAACPRDFFELATRGPATEGPTDRAGTSGSGTGIGR